MSSEQLHSEEKRYSEHQQLLSLQNVVFLHQKHQYMYVKKQNEENDERKINSTFTQHNKQQLLFNRNKQQISSGNNTNNNNSIIDVLHNILQRQCCHNNCLIKFKMADLIAERNVYRSMSREQQSYWIVTKMQEYQDRSSGHHHYKILNEPVCEKAWRIALINLA